VNYPNLDQLDTETRVLLALDLLDRGDPLHSTTREVTEACGLSRSTTLIYLMGLRSRGFVVGDRGKRWSFRCTEKGTRRAKGIRSLKPRQRLIFATFRRVGEGHYKSIAEAAGLDANGVSQSLGSLQDRELITPAYNSGRYGWVYAA